MGYSISGLITNFKYSGDLPHIYLISDFVFIPLSNSTVGYMGHPEDPFEELSAEIRRYAKKLSFSGIVAFVEADFFGGDGAQASVVWENGKIIYGPNLSRHSYRNDEFGAINEVLIKLGVYRHESKDEFDTVGLARNRSNEEWLEEIANCI